MGAEVALASAVDRRAVGPTGHDATTVDLLLRLHFAPGQRLRAVDLCEQLLKSASHLSRRIDRAEAEGLVERTPDPHDRRASLVALTDVGREVVAGMAPRLHAVLNESIYRVLDRGEIDTLVDLLGRIEAASRTCSEREDPSG